jgi:hypothetical protein
MQKRRRDIQMVGARCAVVAVGLMLSLISVSNVSDRGDVLRIAGVEVRLGESLASVKGKFENEYRFISTLPDDAQTCYILESATDERTLGEVCFAKKGLWKVSRYRTDTPNPDGGTLLSELGKFVVENGTDGTAKVVVEFISQDSYRSGTLIFRVCGERELRIDFDTEKQSVLVREILESFDLFNDR